MEKVRVFGSKFKMPHPSLAGTGANGTLFLLFLSFFHLSLFLSLSLCGAAVVVINYPGKREEEKEKIPSPLQSPTSIGRALERERWREEEAHSFPPSPSGWHESFLSLLSSSCFHECFSLVDLEVLKTSLGGEGRGLPSLSLSRVRVLRERAHGIFAARVFPNCKKIIISL